MPDLLVRQACRLIQEWRTIDPGIGLESREPIQVERALLKQAGVAVEDEVVPVPYLFVPDCDRGGELYIGGLNTHQRLAVYLRVVGRLWDWAPSQDAVDVAATTCVLHQAGRQASDSWAGGVVSALADEPRLWTGRSLSSLLGLAEQVMVAMDVAPPVAEAHRLSATARGMYEEARRLRRRGEHERAVANCESAIELATTAGDWETVVNAHLPWAASASQRGNCREALHILHAARRYAREHSLKERGGEVMHQLFTLTSDMGLWEEAEKWARKARAAYGAGHPDLIRLALDAGVHWVHFGEFQRGLPLLRAASEDQTAFNVNERMLAWGFIARAAGGVDDEGLYQFAYGRVHHLRLIAPTPLFWSDALLNLARGAVALKDWAEGEALACRALESASNQRESKCVFEAEAVLASARAHSRAEPARRRTAGGESQAQALAANLYNDLGASLGFLLEPAA